MQNTNQYAPNGVSFYQIKKDAKKLKKKTEITQQQALNKVTLELTGFDSWEDLLDYDKDQGTSIAKITLFKEDDKEEGKIVKERHKIIYADQPVFLADFVTGSGAKTFILNNKTKKILYVTSKNTVSSVKKTIVDLGLENEDITVVDFSKLHRRKEKYFNESYDKIIIDEFHMSKSILTVVKECYDYAVKNKIVVFQFSLKESSFRMFLRTGVYGSTAYGKHTYSKYISNFNDDIAKKGLYFNRHYPLYDYQIEMIEKHIKMLK